MTGGVKAFEDDRWSTRGSVLGFRHTAALQVIGEGSVLDLGCGDGILLSRLGKKNPGSCGLDISPEAVKRCAAQGIAAEVFDFSAEALPFPDASFDYVVMLDVLEHVYDPARLLSEAARVSRASLIISVPNFNSLPARIQVLVGRVPENNTPRKGHIYWFNYRVLRGILDGAHLTILSMKANTVYGSVPILGTVTRFLCGAFPDLFALSFVIRAAKR
jgi:methionine biosynthesis protein MetW